MAEDTWDQLLAGIRERVAAIAQTPCVTPDEPSQILTSLDELSACYQHAVAQRAEMQQTLVACQMAHASISRYVASFMDCIPSSLVVIDRSLRVLSVNKNFIDKSRLAKGDIYGHTIKGILPSAFVRYTQMDQEVQKVFRTGLPLDGSKVTYRAPGLPRRVYFYRLFPLAVGETVENVLLFMDDITEREELGEEVRRVERHLAGVVECASDLVISLDPQGRILSWNQAAEQVSGLRFEKAKGKALVSVCATEQHPVMAEMLRRLAQGEGAQHAEIGLLGVSDQPVPIAWSFSSMRDDEGKVFGIVAVGRDLSEQRHLELQLARSAKMASLGMMAGGIAHEVRNPLGIISAGVQLLLEHPADAQLRAEAPTKILAATKRASSIIENLLRFAQPQGAEMEVLDVHAVLEDALALSVFQLEMQHIEVKTSFPTGPLKIFGNPLLLQQVFTNIILNAYDAMPGGGVLEIATGPTKENQVVVRLSDTGVGILPDHLPRMFDPFFTTKPPGKGTGLGLFICYSIIQQHHGTIDVSSRPNLGTTFTVTLPGDAE